MSAHLVNNLSAYARMRHYDHNKDRADWVFIKDLKVGNPETPKDVVVDALGYRNPKHYLCDRGGKIDVLLVGDSFIWGTEKKTVADYLRVLEPSRSVYSIGIPGEGIPQWRGQYQRFISFAKHAPKTVVLNFYSGNDISDTHFYHRLREYFGAVDGEVYHTYKGDYAHCFPPGRLPRFLSLLELRQLIMRSLWPPSTYAQHGVGGILLAWEPAPASLDKEIMDAIGAAVDGIRVRNLATRIVLSYICSSACLYGGNSARGRQAVVWQAENTRKLEACAKKLGIIYVDVTPELRKRAGVVAIFGRNDAHFSANGYKLYSELLAQRID